MRRFPEALRYADVALRLAPALSALLVGKAFIQINIDGNTRAARETIKSADVRDFPELPAILSLFDFYDRRFRESLEDLDQYPKDTLDLQTLYQPKSLIVGLTYVAMNDTARARPACETAREILEKETAKNPRDARKRAALGLALACVGRNDEAVREAKLGTDLTPVSSDAIDGPFYLAGLANVYALVGDKDAACDILEKLLAIPSEMSVPILRLDPAYDSLRGFPRFQKLIEKKD